MAAMLLFAPVANATLIEVKDGEADEKIDCGPGSDAKEKAKYDKGVDPKRKSC